tara:strand:+ start:1430 stop:1945 length:516 start_codon:yes stop_codon:yes gene_type:complete
MSKIKKKHIQTRIDIPRDLTPRQRELLAEKIVRKIRERTKEGKSATGRPFKGYSKEYKESLDFKLAGKSDTVDLRSTGDMLSELDVLSINNRYIMVGYEKDHPDAGKVQGNVTGEYGNDKPVTRPRDFIGLPKKWVEILAAEVRLELPDFEEEKTSVIANILSRIGVNKDG